MMTRAEILTIRSLADRKGREDHGLFVVEGRKMVAEAMKSGFTVREIIATEKPAAEFPGARVVGPSRFERISRLKSPQGVLALVELPRYELPVSGKGELIIALDCVQDPGNLGTIIRMADWFGVRDIVCSPDSVDCFNPKVIQATMGSLFRVGVRYTELEDFLTGFDVAVPVYGAFLDGESVYTQEFNPDSVLVMGNEGRGISKSVEKFVTHRVSIPSFASGGRAAESLNVAVATAVIVSEIKRRTL